MKLVMTNLQEKNGGIDKKYFRPTEVDELLGDPSKAYKDLGWKPKTDLKELVRIMIDSDLDLIKRNI